MSSWESSWGTSEKYAYRMGIAKGRALEREEAALDAFASRPRRFFRWSDWAKRQLRKLPDGEYIMRAKRGTRKGLEFKLELVEPKTDDDAIPF